MKKYAKNHKSSIKDITIIDADYVKEDEKKLLEIGNKKINKNE